MRYIEDLGEYRSRGIGAIGSRHTLADKPSTGRVIVFHNDLISTVQRPAVQLQSGVGVSHSVATVNGVPFAVPYMTIVSPHAAVNADYGHTKGFDVDNIIIVREQTAAASVSDQLQTIHVAFKGESRRGEHLLQRFVNDPRICTLFRQCQASVKQDFFCHVVEILGAELALVEGSGQASNQAGAGEGSLIFDRFRLAVQHILVRFRPFHLTVRQLISELDRHRGMFIHILINTRGVIWVIIVLVIQDHELHCLLWQSAAERVNIMRLPGGNNILVGKFLLYAVQYIFQARSAIRQGVAKGNHNLVAGSHFRADLDGFGSNRDNRAFQNFTTQGEIHGHTDRPLLVTGVKGQRQSGESVRNRELTGNDCCRGKTSICVTHDGRNEAVIHGARSRNNNCIPVQRPTVQFQCRIGHLVIVVVVNRVKL